MITMTNLKNGEKKVYTCKREVINDLCLANIGSLLKVALTASDDTIRKTYGGEKALLELVEGYAALAKKIDKLFDRIEVDKFEDLL